MRKNADLTMGGIVILGGFYKTISMDSLFALQLLDSNPEDVDVAQKVFADSLGFLSRVEGHKFVPDNVASECMESLPQGLSPERKKSFALLSKKGVVAYYEYLTNFPEDGICYLGLLLVPEKFQKKGIGRYAYDLIETQFKILYGAKEVQLGYVASGGSGKFWEKMGFKECGERKPYEVNNVKSEYVFMKKALKEKNGSKK